jgi:hypothetical protein
MACGRHGSQVRGSGSRFTLSLVLCALGGASLVREDPRHRLSCLTEERKKGGGDDATPHQANPRGMEQGPRGSKAGSPCPAGSARTPAALSRRSSSRPPSAAATGSARLRVASMSYHWPS